jgi:propionyl-CoA synthetase
VAAFRNSVIVEKLPKTRSGKVLRGTLKKIVDGELFKMPATIEDETVLEKIKDSVHAYG